MQGRGMAVCLPADVDTDLVIAARYLRTRTGTSGRPMCSRISILRLLPVSWEP